jgi:dUTP pyrophosphatase
MTDNFMIVKFKKLSPEAIIPQQTIGNAGMDMTAISFKETDDYTEYDTGIAAEIPEGYVGLLFPRSSNSNMDLLLCNSVGVVDSAYRGSIRFRYKLVANDEKKKVFYTVYNVGDRVGQLIIMPYPTIRSLEVDELSPTDRNNGGFGSTGK